MRGRSGRWEVVGGPVGSFDNVSVYERLGVRPSINAVGTGTVVGGSGPPKIVGEKMEEASWSFTDMGELLTRAALS